MSKSIDIAWVDGIIKGAEPPAGPKPPPGYTPIPGSKKGGYHKRVGTDYSTWYPHTGEVSIHESSSGTHDGQKRHGPAGSTTQVYTVPSGHSVHSTTRYTAQSGATKHKAEKTVGVVRHKGMTPSKHRNFGEAMDHLHDLHYEDTRSRAKVPSGKYSVIKNPDFYHDKARGDHVSTHETVEEAHESAKNHPGSAVVRRDDSNSMEAYGVHIPTPGSRKKV